MISSKTIKALVLLIILLACGSSGYFIWQLVKHHDQNSSNIASVSNKVSSSSSSSDLAVGNQSNLGQLGSSDNSSGQILSQGENDSSNPSSSSVDPSTFSQYQKYIDSHNPLFGDIKTGSGTAVTSGQKVSITYEGWLTNGNMFGESGTDSSGNAQLYTFTFGSGSVIPGLQDGMEGMKVGGERLIVIPPALGYGNNPPSSSIPANSVLVFDVKLISAQ